MTNPEALYESVRDEMGRVLVGNEEVIEGLTVALLTRGHVLLEGVPGVAKTTIANSFARATGLRYGRIQMTPDLLPADITGTHVYREETGEFELRRGPVFANVVVADEINRATPKTQSAFLEAMQEGTVTIEGTTLELPDPFLVVATQNPVEMEGTFELPVAQRDRFQSKLTVGLPDEREEQELLDRFDATPDLGPEDVAQVVTPEEIAEATEAVAEIHVAPAVKEYIGDVVHAVRNSDAVTYGGSPRASLAFLDAAKARAAIRGREYVIPDDVKAFVEPILAHRVVLSHEAVLSDASVPEVVADILEDVRTPGNVEGPDEIDDARPTED